MTEINTDDGTSGHFEWLKNAGVSINFDKSVKADATEADKFTAKGAHVIVYFIGDGDVRTHYCLARSREPARSRKPAAPWSSSTVTTAC